MRVNLAAQVLNEAVGNVLNNFGPEEAEGTGQFCIMMEKCFDYLNVRNTKEHIIKRKPFLKPYESVECSDHQGYTKNTCTKFHEKILNSYEVLDKQCPKIPLRLPRRFMIWK